MNMLWSRFFCDTTGKLGLRPSNYWSF